MPRIILLPEQEAIEHGFELNETDRLTVSYGRRLSDGLSWHVTIIDGSLARFRIRAADVARPSWAVSRRFAKAFLRLSQAERGTLRVSIAHKATG